MNLWLIYSLEHNGWWAPKETGYTPNIEEAGLYKYERACEIVENANKHLSTNVPPNEAMIMA